MEGCSGFYFSNKLISLTYMQWSCKDNLPKFIPLFQLSGSLIIMAENVMGSMKIDESGDSILHYGTRCGAACIIQNSDLLSL